MNTSLKFFVAGLPMTAGSKRAVPTPAGTRVIESGSRAVRDAKAAWRADIIEAARRADGWDPERGPVVLSCHFFLRRPQSHYRTGRFAGELRASAPIRPTTTPDLSKLARAVEDALTVAGVVWRDDSQVVSCQHSKFYADAGRPVGVKVQVSAL